MFVVFDLETTGFSSIRDDVVQFAYIVYDDRNYAVRAESLYFYYEGMSWSEEAYNVHKLSKEFLKTHEDKFEENLIKMYATLMLANVCGHNVKSFDCPFAVNWLARMGMPGLQFRVIQDTMTAFKPVTRRPKISLIKLSNLLGITDDTVIFWVDRVFGDKLGVQAHNAAFDTMRTALITIMGIHKNYINFNPETFVDSSYADEDLETEEVDIPRDNLLIRVRTSQGVKPILLTSQFTYNDIPHESWASLVGTTQCLHGVFEEVGDCYQLNTYITSLRFRKKSGSASSIELVIRNSEPVDFYVHNNRANLVNGFNAGAEQLEWRFENV